ncbi:CAP domain-containing protein [Bacillus massiliglaciei]|uniref:CAP domain-containing protein n=1 Tax=Bacillus massiliglaciei TaxID=1816693 RepID=UPI000DA60EB4|nr:CAP domain-containing protein [Bacillus massiliglaciei]
MKKIMISTIMACMLFPVSAFGEESYKVIKGDTLWNLSSKYNVSLSDLLKANPDIVNPNSIKAGQSINIPSGANTKETATKTMETQVIELVNSERKKAGLPALKMDSSLSKTATIKSQDMRDSQYFSHTSPVYGSPFDLMKTYGIAYKYAGENIAAGQTSPNSVIKSWMNSPGHKANILSKNYTRIGVGYVKGGTYSHYWTQHFSGN